MSCAKNGQSGRLVDDEKTSVLILQESDEERRVLGWLASTNSIGPDAVETIRTFVSSASDTS